MRNLSGAEVLNPELNLEWVIQHPHSSNIMIDGSKRIVPVLSVLTEMSVRAAELLYDAHPGATVLFTGETCYPDRPDFPDTADLILDKVRESNIPESSVVTLHRLSDGRFLNNTYLQFQAIADYFQLTGEPKAETVIGSTLEYHMPRFQRSADNYRVPIGRYVTVEAVLHASSIHEYDRYIPYINDGKKRGEQIANALLRIDPMGRILNKIMASKGARLGDVVETETGQLVFEGGMAIDKLKRLETEIEEL